MEDLDFENLTLSEIRYNFHMICRAINIGAKKHVDEKSRNSQLNNQTRKEWEEMVLEEWIQQACDELEIEFVREEDLIQ